MEATALMWPLPNNSIGISDILDWRECPRRMQHGMRRHVVLPNGQKDEPPGHTDWTNAYGSAIHDAIHIVETVGCDNDEAVDVIWPKYATYLAPDELALLKEDMDTYRGDTPTGMELIAAERDVRVPLLVYEGVQVYFRFKIDALYRRIQDHTAFYQRDYKSSKHRRSQADVDKDPQMWAYNFGIHDLYPECASLIQSYEQLRFGNLLTSKNGEQRQQMREWLERTVLAMIADTTHEPKQNEWCPYCPLVLTCDQTKRATRYWRGRLAVLAPMTLEGRKTKIAFGSEADDLEYMMREVLPQIIRTRKHIEAAEKGLKALIEGLTNEERERLGWKLAERKVKVTDPEGLRMIHEAMGDAFYEVISLVGGKVETVLGKPKKGEELSPQLKLIRNVELQRVGATMLVQKT